MAAVGNTYSVLVGRDQIRTCRDTREDRRRHDRYVIDKITENTTPAQFDALRASFPSYDLTDVSPGVGYGCTALHRAAKQRNAPLVRHIVQLAGEKGKALMDYGDYGVETPLMLAIQDYQPGPSPIKTVEALIELGADVNLSDGWKKTALGCAIQHGNIAIQTLLIRRKAVVARGSISDEERRAILELARQVQETSQVVANSTGLLPPLAKIVDQYL